MNGAEYIAEFLSRVGSDRVFLLTGGACAFMVDAVARHPKLSYTCFQHEQASSMAADSVWRVSKKVGVTLATSGPGATNLITGIACSYFDSIPTLHITGQVNQRESNAYHGAAVRQTGFQETRIVDMVRPITKYAVKVTTAEELRQELAKAYEIAVSGRMGPVLVDVPMDIQQIEVPYDVILPTLSAPPEGENIRESRAAIQATLDGARRPIVLCGGGVTLAGAQRVVGDWLAQAGIPFVASWAGISAFDHDVPNYIGQIGVYGNRGANFCLQNADMVLVLGSRLDNRQRSGNAKNFATGAVVHVVDVDVEELRKYQNDGYRTTLLDIKDIAGVLSGLTVRSPDPQWTEYVSLMKSRYFGRENSSSAVRLNSLSPYDVVRKLAETVAEDAIVIGDTGAAICWLFQAFKVKRHELFTAGGNSPMGYSLPAAIGAKLERPERQVICYTGDGGFQLNLQELQTLVHYGLDVAIILMNNSSYGIIKQFQDSYLGSRYEASREGYSVPDFGKIAYAYGVRYLRVESASQITPDLFGNGPILIDVALSEHTLIEPKLEMGRPVNDQFPYLETREYEEGNRFIAYPRPPDFPAPSK